MTASLQFQRAKSLLSGAESVVVFTGAGISAESGLPTFRSGPNALWNDPNAATYATPHGYRAHAKEAWAWYSMRAQTAARVQPNPGHFAIVEIERRVPDFLLVTQNVDGLHHRAGSKNILELHGSLRQFRCFDCGVLVAPPEPSTSSACKSCDGLLRPDVVFFEENLPAGAVERAFDAAERCDVLISVGTSNLVWPAAQVPAHAFAAGAHVVIVNVELSGQIPPGDRVLHLAGSAGDVLPRLTALAWSD